MLVDPWLEGDLTFAEQDWLYRGKKRVINASKGERVDIDQIAAETDVVVLTQVRRAAQLGLPSEVCGSGGLSECDGGLSECDHGLPQCDHGLPQCDHGP